MRSLREGATMAVRRPQDFSHHEAQLDGIRIHYVREGSGRIRRMKA